MKCLGELIRTQAATRGDAPAITFGERTITFAELNERSNRVAAGLVAEGIGPQDRIAYLDKNGPEYFELLFGAGKANAVNVAVHWRLAPPEMAHLISDAG